MQVTRCPRPVVICTWFGVSAVMTASSPTTNPLSEVASFPAAIDQ